MVKFILPLLALLFGSGLAQAHYLWIETGDSGQARVYFGEFNEGVREVAGGRLDERASLTGRAVDGEGKETPVSFEKKSDHFATTFQGADWLLVQDPTSPVMDWSASGIGIVKPMFYARAATGEVTAAAGPSLTLDLLPDAGDPSKLRVFFKDQPLPKAKVKVHAPNQWSQELTADENGAVTIETPWPGQYVVEVIHKERDPGEFEGKPYDAIRHRVTWTHAY